MVNNEHKEKAGLKNSLVKLQGKKHQKDSEENNTTPMGSKSIVTVCGLIVALICAIGCAYYWSKAAIVGVAEAKEAYDNIKNKRVDEIRQFYEDEGRKAGEKEFHTSNSFVITIDNVREVAKLEVFKVSDVVYIIADESDQVWLKAIGSGVYTVNLAAGDYLIDNDRQYVLVRLPKPELAFIGLDNVEQIFYKNGSIISNGNIGEGEELARKQRADAERKILEDIKADQRISQYARESAETLIKSLVRSFNPEISDIVVDVEFFD